MGTLRAAGLSCLLCALSAAASAQTINIQPAQRQPVDPTGGLIHVQVGINLFVPGPADETPESAALRDRARASIYDMAARECDLLREKLADECRIETVNLNLNRQRQQVGGQQVEGFQINSMLGFRITPKAPVNP